MKRFLAVGVIAFAVLVGALSCSGPDSSPAPYATGNTGGMSSAQGGSGGSGTTDNGGNDGETAEGGMAEAGSNGGMAIPGVSCGDVECSPFATCADDKASKCECADGLSGDGLRCADTNECSDTPDICGEHASCENTFGSYDCRCDSGYRWSGSACVDIEECADKPCDPAATCAEADGGFTCTCGSGLAGNGFFCKTDACAAMPCGANGTCLNAPDKDLGYVCQCELGSQGHSNCSPCGEDLVLTDHALRAAANAQLGRDAADQTAIPLTALAEQTTLDASGFDVTSLSGLSCWTSLERLDLSNNAGLLAKNSTALSELNRLTELDLDCTAIDDLSALSYHPALRVLSVNVLNCTTPTLLQDASAAGTISGLETLDLRGHNLQSVAFLAGSKNLRSLWLGHNLITTAKDLAGLPLLRELELSANGLGDLTGIEHLAHLESLGVSENALASLAPTAALTSLSTLIASNNRVESLPDWRGLANLRELTLDFNRVKSIAPIAGLNQVTWVSLAQNDLPTLSPLLAGTFRGTLVLAGNPFACDAETENIQTLRTRGIDLISGCEP